MKVVAFNGSPHPNGTTAMGISVMANALAREGIETELVQVGGKQIHGCIGCMECSRQKVSCVLQDGDIIAWAHEKIDEAYGVILASPVYYGGIAGSFKSFLDRLFFSSPGFSYKVGATVTSLRRSGGISVFHQLNNYFNLAQMIVTPGIYWDVIHGNSGEEAKQDLEGMQILETQGKNMAWLLKALLTGTRDWPAPPPVERKWTNFIR